MHAFLCVGSSYQGSQFCLSVKLLFYCWLRQSDPSNTLNTTLHNAGGRRVCACKNREIVVTFSKVVNFAFMIQKAEPDKAATPPALQTPVGSTLSCSPGDSRTQSGNPLHVNYQSLTTTYPDPPVTLLTAFSESHRSYLTERQTTVEG